MKRTIKWLIPKVNLWFLFVLCGWVGIVIYTFYYPVSVSLIGLIYYLLIHRVVAFTAAFVRKLLPGSNHSNWIETSWIKFVLKSRFFGRVRRTLRRKFPKIGLLFHKKYDYKNIRLDSDFKALKAQYQKKNKRENLRHFIHSDPQARYRWRYRGHRDHKIQKFLKENQELTCERDFWMLYLRALLMFLFEIPAEDGVFLAPLYFMGMINLPAAMVSALAFSFAHCRYSVFNCLQLTAATVLIILLILPEYGLLTCIVGHVLLDLLLMAPTLMIIIKHHRAFRAAGQSSRAIEV